MKAITTGIGGILLSTTLFASALAADVDVNATTTGLAMRGYDPVSYFTNGAPARGNWKITAQHNDATYRFASEENKAKFMKNPAAYAPAYGGYCAFGTAMGYKFDGDPNVWKIVDKKLYLNLNKDIQVKWEGDRANYINTANVKWTSIKDKAPQDLK